MPEFQVYAQEVTIGTHPQAPVSGRAVYFVTNETPKYVTLFHPWTLTEFNIPLNDFIRNNGLTYWPEDKRDAPPYEKFNAMSIARHMEEKLQDYAMRQKQHPAQATRKLIAAIRGIPLEQVPQYKEPSKVKSSHGVSRERGPRKPGVIDAIQEFLEDGYTVDEFVKKLGERFPERVPDAMRNTVKCQLARLPKNKNRAINKNEVAGRGMVFTWGKSGATN